MRASRSCPRSSVPNGCAADGPFNRAVKSISLIGTRHAQGPTRTPTTMIARMMAPASASLCRRKRRHASAPRSRGGRDGAPPLKAAVVPALGASVVPAFEASVVPAFEALAVRDAGVEPAIEDVGEQVEEDHE